MTGAAKNASGQSGVLLRRATAADAPMVADVYLGSFKATYRFPLAHADDEVRGWIRDVVLPTKETWIAADASGLVVGMMALESAELDQLYVAPGWTGHGIGSRLVALAKRRRPNGLSLYTFQVNHRARRFYERHGFILVDENDGSRNEEGQPDVQYTWRPDRLRPVPRGGPS
jgi:GNAT superfamily N-acetyltransferase